MMRYNLEERLVGFSVSLIQTVYSLPRSRAYDYLSDQLTRSACSAALNYAEAQSAESRKDFIHKIRIVLKELRETYVGLKIIRKLNTQTPGNNIDPVLKECDELLAIFTKSAVTASQKHPDRKISH
jgi:four helix bundle protein